MAALPSSWPVGATVSFIAVSVAPRKRDDSGDTLNSFFYSLHLEARGSDLTVGVHFRVGVL